MAKADIEIGQRAYKEVVRLFPTMVEAKRKLRCNSKGNIYKWSYGVAPSARYLQRLFICGADIEYILTGRRHKNEMSSLQ
jgi:hypothetical protein